MLVLNIKKALFIKKKASKICYVPDGLFLREEILDVIVMNHLFLELVSA
jgi:hypothetical protein